MDFRGENAEDPVSIDIRGFSSNHEVAKLDHLTLNAQEEGSWVVTFANVFFRMI